MIGKQLYLTAWNVIFGIKISPLRKGAAEWSIWGMKMQV